MQKCHSPAWPCLPALRPPPKARLPQPEARGHAFSFQGWCPAAFVILLPNRLFVLIVSIFLPLPTKVPVGQPSCSHVRDGLCISLTEDGSHLQASQKLATRSFPRDQPLRQQHSEDFTSRQQSHDPTGGQNGGRL